jgi:hypothetical protein
VEAGIGETGSEVVTGVDWRESAVLGGSCETGSGVPGGREGVVTGVDWREGVVKPGVECREGGRGDGSGVEW